MKRWTLAGFSAGSNHYSIAQTPPSDIVYAKFYVPVNRVSCLKFHTGLVNIMQTTLGHWGDMRQQQQLVGFDYQHHGERIQNDPFSPQERQRLMEEIASLKEKVNHLEHTADTDPMVPVKNRRAFIREIKRAQTVMARYQIPSYMIFFDLNKFKQINDYYGHGVGDELLIKIGLALQGAVRDCDIVARLGGDEFGVILFKTDETIAQTKAVILNRQIARQKIIRPDGEISLTAAWGTSECRPEDSITQILERADYAMYHNKHHG